MKSGDLLAALGCSVFPALLSGMMCFEELGEIAEGGEHFNLGCFSGMTFRSVIKCYLCCVIYSSLLTFRDLKNIFKKMLNTMTRL